MANENKNTQREDAKGQNKNFHKRKPYYKKKHRAQKQKDTKENTIDIQEYENDEVIDAEEFDYEMTDIPGPQNDVPSVTIEIDSEETTYIHVTGVRFKPNGKIYYFEKGDFQGTDGSNVIVETSRGVEFGEVAFADKLVTESSIIPPLRPILRAANDNDIFHNKENKEKEEEAFGLCLEKIQKHGLEMKLVDVQYTFDNSKLLFYFTSAGRVDFRDLVKDLASVFKTRIELRQIGIRDEAKIIGGLGACGRPLCCTSFLSDFAQVSIKMAKEQNLSLNSGKISGCCGRLMCCLEYEYKTYAEEAAKTPALESVVKTPDGIGTVTEVIPLAGNIKVRLKDQPDVAPKLYHRDSVKVISRPKAKEEEDIEA